MANKVDTIAALFEQTIVGRESDIAVAHKTLSEQSSTPGFVEALVNILGVGEFDVGIKQAAVIFLKNMVRVGWKEGKEEVWTRISEQDKILLKRNVLELTIRAPSKIKSQLGVITQEMGTHDFPGNWPAITEEVASMLQSGDFAVLEGALFFLDSLLRRYREISPSEEVYKEIQHVLDVAAKRLLSVLDICIATIQNEAEIAARGAVFLEQLMILAKDALNVVFSLSYLDIPEIFEDCLDNIYGMFAFILSYSGATYLKAHPQSDDDDETQLESLQALVCDIITHYEKNYEEHSEKYVQTLLQTVGAMLASYGKGIRYDVSVTSAIRYLSQIAMSTAHHAIFEGQDAQKVLCEQVIMPNVGLREDEEELFEDNPFEYVRRDLEQAKVDSRRNGCVELCKGMCKHHQESFTRTTMGYIEALIGQYNADKNKWREKEVAICIFEAMAVQHTSHARVGTILNQHMDIAAFFSGNVAPELSSGSSSTPILRASCLRFYSFFRSHIPHDVTQQLFSSVLETVGAPQCVVHTYASALVDKLLLVRETLQNGRPGQVVVSRALVGPMVPVFLGNVFQVLSTEESKVNGYVMGCLKRVIMVMKEDMAQYTGEMVDRLNSIISRVCQNNTSIPLFSRNLFETIAALVRYIGKGSQEAIASFEYLLFPSFQHILTTGAVELYPFAFQIFAQMLEHKQPPVSEAYRSLFEPLLSPHLWDASNRGNIPPLVRLLAAYLRHDVNYVVKEQKSLQKFLLIFEKLISTRTTEASGVALMRAIFLCVSMAELKNFVPDITKMLLGALSRSTDRIQNGKAGAKSVIPFLELFSIIGSKIEGGLVEMLDSIQPGLCAMILEKVWLKYAHFVDRVGARRVVIIGLANFLSSPSTLSTEGYQQLYGQILIKTMELIELLPAEADDMAAPEEDEDTTKETYSSEFVPLRNASRPPDDPFPGIQNPRVYLATSIRSVSEKRPGVLPPIIQQSLQGEVLQRLFSYFAEAGVKEPFIV